MKLLKNDRISFTYKGGRKVIGTVTGVFRESKKITLDLETDYIGRNVEWYAGENKAFNINEMKEINFLPQVKPP